MLISRKRKETKEIAVYLNNKPLEQVNMMKYLGIIIDNKFKFSEHVRYAAEKCTKLIYSLSKSAKISGDSNMKRSRLYIKERYYHFYYMELQSGPKC
jgi:hypothetical protein